MEDKSLKSLSDAKEKKSYVKPLLSVHGNLDKLTQMMSMGPDDGCYGGSEGGCSCAS